MVQKVWDWLSDITQLIYESNIALTAVKCLLREDLIPSKQNKHKPNLVAYLIKVTLWHLWEAKNRSLFEGFRSDHSGVIRAIKRTISSRIQGALTLPGATARSVHTLWAYINVLCIVRGEELILSPNIN